METLSPQFEQALTRIEINGVKRKRAIEAHTEIREYLQADKRLCLWGVDPVLIGSYARRTGIYPGRDVDVFAKLPKLDTTANPQDVFECVRDSLVAKYGTRAKPQARSIKISFPSDGDEFAVDVVPAVRHGQRWGIPNRDVRRWTDRHPTARWIETDPERLSDLTSALNGTIDVSGRGAYVPTVKLVRQARDHHLHDEAPGGLYFELLTFWAFTGGITGASFAEILAAALELIASQLGSSAVLIDPVLGSRYQPEPHESERTAASMVFRGLATKAARALTVDQCTAAVLWRDILGKNDRGSCFPLPEGCDEKGNRIKKVRGVASLGSPEPSGFARDRDA